MASPASIVTCPLCNFQMTINSQKLKESQEKLEKLLTEKKALNSKVVTEAYSQFKNTAVKVRNGQAADVKSAIRRLEQCLKDEGSYKNVKTEFEKIKKDITEVTDTAEHMTDDKRRNAKLIPGPEPKTRATTVTLSQTYTRQNAKNKDHHTSINRPVIGKDEHSNPSKKDGSVPKTKVDKSAPSQKKEETASVKSRKDDTSPRDKKDDAKRKRESIQETKTDSLTPEEITALNKMISRLFSQLEIDIDSTEAIGQKGHAQKPTPQKMQSQTSLAGALRVKKIKTDREEANLENIFERLKQLEDELTKRRKQKTDDSSRVLSLQTDVQKLEKQIAEQNKQLDRFRGLQYITNKAKGKHVELIEERHQTEKKDMEIKIQALEKDLKKNVQGTMKEKEDLENRVGSDIARLRQEINRLDSFVDSEQTDESPRSVKLKTKAKDDSNIFEMDELFTKIKNIGNEIQALREQRLQLKRSAEEKSDWESSFKDLEKEVEMFCIDISTGAGFPMSEFGSTEALKSLRSSKTYAGPSKWKLNKAKTLMLNYVRKFEDTERVMWAKTNEVDDAHLRLKELTTEIEKVFSHIRSRESTILNGSEQEQQPGKESRKSAKHPKQESKKDVEKGLEDSMELLSTAQKVDYVGRTINSYENLLKVQSKAIKQYEIDFEVIHSKLSPDTEKGFKRQKSSSVKQALLDDSTIIDAKAILGRIDEANSELLWLREQNKEMKSSLNTITKAKDYLDETSKELTDLCVQHNVSDELISGTGEDDTLSNIKRKINLCQTQFSKKLEELQVKESKLKKLQSDVESIAKEVHKLFLNTLEAASSKTDDEKRETSEDPQPKLIIVELKTVNENYVALQENVQKLTSDMQEKEKQLADKERSFKHSESNLNDQITRLQMQVTVREEELQERHKETKLLRDEANQKNTENTRLQLELQSRYTSNLGKSDEEKIYLRNKIDDLQRKLESAEHNLSEALTEKFNLLTRVMEGISASAGTKLTDDNPAIANLSDPNRPTKLAEKYSELYDNEWTNAFETLTNQFYMEEKDAIACLLDVLKKSFTFCQSLAERQSDDLFKVLLMLHVDGIVEPGFKEGLQKITKETKKQVKDIRKSVAPVAVATVFGLFLSSDQKKGMTDEQIQACESYINRCIELCWLMNVQDPPVQISWDIQKEEKFNSDVYRYYTKSGDIVEFLVWPAMRLHSNGPLLCKGVVQGR